MPVFASIASGQQVLYEFEGREDRWNFGQQVVGVGDTNGDGNPDILACGAYAKSDRGVARSYSGRSGDLLLKFAGGQGFAMGWDASGHRDFDGDGLPDLAISSPAESFGIGRVEVFSGTTGVPLLTLFGDGSGAGFGEVCKTLGDVDGDGVPDLLVGTRNHPWGYYDGRVQIFSGASGTEIHDIHGPSRSEFATDACDLGDLDGDGRSDFAVSAPGDARGGSITVFSGATGTELAKLSGDDTFGIEYFACPGDLDSDGLPELIVSDFNYKEQGRTLPDYRIGRAILYSSTGAGFARVHDWKGDPWGAFFGLSVAGAGDVDRDGVPDLIVGTPGDQYHEGPVLGYTRILSGRTKETLYTHTDSDRREQFGYSVDGVGDANLDGFSDVVVGSLWAGTNGQGKATVFAGAPLFLDARPKAPSPGQELVLQFTGGPKDQLAAIQLAEVDGVRIDQWLDFGVFDRKQRFRVEAIVPQGLSGRWMTFVGYTYSRTGGVQTTVAERVDFR